MAEHDIVRPDTERRSGPPRPEAPSDQTRGGRAALRREVRATSYEEGRARLSPRGAGGRDDPPAGTTYQSYTVVRGDTLSGIARRFSVPGGYPALARLNGIRDPNLILVGQVLRIPAPEPAPRVESQGGPGGETLPAEDPAERAELEAFMGRDHEARNQSLGGSGNFDLLYSPATSVARVEVRVAFEFVSGSVADMIAALFNDREVGDYLWNDAEKEAFKVGFISQVHETWSRRHTMKCTREAGTLARSPSWPDLRAEAEVHVVEDAENPHFTVRVQRIPRGEFHTSSVDGPVRDEHGRIRGPGLVELDSNDLTGVHKAGASPGVTQRAAVHEFGHMLGLQDEYPGPGRPSGRTTRQGSRVGAAAGSYDDRIMAGGEIVQQAHYASILGALNVATAPVPFGFE